MSVPPPPAAISSSSAPSMSGGRGAVTGSPRTMEEELSDVVASVGRRVLQGQACSEISPDAANLIRDCMFEFISSLSADVLSVATAENRKAISVKDFINTLHVFGYEHYVPSTEVFCDKLDKHLKTCAKCNGQPPKTEHGHKPSTTAETTTSGDNKRVRQSSAKLMESISATTTTASSTRTAATPAARPAVVPATKKTKDGKIDITNKELINTLRARLQPAISMRNELRKDLFRLLSQEMHYTVKAIEEFFRMFVLMKTLPAAQKATQPHPQPHPQPHAQPQPQLANVPASSTNQTSQAPVPASTSSTVLSAAHTHSQHPRPQLQPQFPLGQQQLHQSHPALQRQHANLSLGNPYQPISRFQPQLQSQPYQQYTHHPQSHRSSDKMMYATMNAVARGNHAAGQTTHHTAASSAAAHNTSIKHEYGGSHSSAVSAQSSSGHQNATGSVYNRSSYNASTSSIVGHDANPGANGANHIANVTAATATTTADDNAGGSSNSANHANVPVNSSLRDGSVRSNVP